MQRKDEFIIHMPEKLNTKSVINFSAYLLALIRDIPYKRYLFDFSRTLKAFPFGILFMATLIKNFMRELSLTNPDIEFVCKYKNTYEAIESYLKHIGFFKYINFDIGREPGEAFGSNTYIPIKNFSKMGLDAQAAQNKKHIGEIIISEAEIIAKIIADAYKSTSEDNIFFLKSAMAYSIREIMRNSIEHSQDEEVTIFAQSFPRTKRIEIAIMDNGVGFLETLSPKYNVSSGAVAIETALRPGVSRTDTEMQTDDAWQNSGFGLYVLSELCKEINNSQLCIASSNAIYSVTKNSIYSKERNVWTPGTTIMFSIGTDNDCYFANILENIIHRGESIARRNNSCVRASKISKMA